MTIYVCYYLSRRSPISLASMSTLAEMSHEQWMPTVSACVVIDPLISPQPRHSILKISFIGLSRSKPSTPQPRRRPRSLPVCHSARVRRSRSRSERRTPRPRLRPVCVIVGSDVEILCERILLSVPITNLLIGRTDRTIEPLCVFPTAVTVPGSTPGGGLPAFHLPFNNLKSKFFGEPFSPAAGVEAVLL